MDRRLAVSPGWYNRHMPLHDAEQVPATVVVKPWGQHRLWQAIVMDGSTVVARLFGLSEQSALERAIHWVAPRATVRADWSAIPTPRQAADESTPQS